MSYKFWANMWLVFCVVVLLALFGGIVESSWHVVVKWFVAVLVSVAMFFGSLRVYAIVRYWEFEPNPTFGMRFWGFVWELVVGLCKVMGLVLFVVFIPLAVVVVWWWERRERKIERLKYDDGGGYPVVWF